MNLIQRKVFSLTVIPLAAIMIARDVLAQPPLSKSDIKPCEAILAKSLPIHLEGLKRGLQSNLDSGDKVRVGWYRRDIDQINGPEPLLAFALQTPPYKPYYDLKDTTFFLKSEEKNLAILRSGDEREMAKVWGGGPFRGQELVNKIITTEKFLCMLNVRLAQLQGKPLGASSPRPGAAATTPTGNSNSANRDSGSADLPPATSASAQVPRSAAVNDCLKFNRDKDNRIAVTNSCNFPVQYSWCLKSPDRSISAFVCKDPYQGEGAAGLRAGGTTALQGSIRATGVRWIACRGAIGEAIPLLSENGKHGCY